MNNVSHGHGARGDPATAGSEASVHETPVRDPTSWNREDWLALLIAVAVIVAVIGGLVYLLFTMPGGTNG